jgi:hypothetical protein
MLLWDKKKRDVTDWVATIGYLRLFIFGHLFYSGIDILLR